MVSELYINNQIVDLSAQKIKYVLQVNDFFDLKSRQSSYSLNIKLNKTSTNLSIFELAGTYPNNSIKPYKRLSVDYFVDGIPIVLDAFGVLKSSDSNSYNFHFYDGNIELYRAIEKLKITDLPFDDFTHTKNIDGVKDTWLNDKPYVYAVADYGGIPEYQNGINVDFLVPSISLEWVFNKIFEVAGFKYAVYSDVLKDKYFTISDAYADVSAEGTFEAVYDVNDYILSRVINKLNERYFGYLFIYEDDRSNHYSEEYKVKHEIKDTGYYDITFSSPSMFPALTGFPFANFNLPNIALAKKKGDSIEIINGTERSYKPNSRKTAFELITTWRNVELKANDTIYVVTVSDEKTYLLPETAKPIKYPIDQISIEVVYKPEDSVSLPEYLSDLPIKDLLQEILIQNALTPIINKDTGVYEFYTLEQRLNAPILDWSDKFSKVTKEDYVIGEYGQKNTFAYKYNDDGDNHNNGEFYVDNAQLKDEEIIKSKFYSSEREQTYFETLNKSLPEFLLWEEKTKETDQGTEITYKELKNHYHFLKVNEIEGNFKITSKGYGQEQTTNKIKYADFSPFEWNNILKNSYKGLDNILNRMSLYEVEVYLNTLDVQGFNFFCRIYIKELGAVFLPNKITYEPGEVATVELIKISEQ